MPVCTSFIVGIVLATPVATEIFYVESNRSLLDPAEAVKALEPFASIRNTSNEVKRVVAKALPVSPACMTYGSEVQGDLLSENIK